MSGDRDSRREADAVIEGAFGFLHKPFDLRQLDHLVARATAPALPEPITENANRQ
jgi:DNA-binding NtrC family response regulator